MSIDIDQAVSGVETVPAAEEQAIVQTNSYQDGHEDYPVYQELLDKPQEAASPAPDAQDRNFAALRSEVDRIKAEREAERREHQLQLDILRANMNRAPAPEPMKRSEMFADKEDDYIPNVAELRAEWQSKELGYQSRLEELEVQSQYPDYAEVLGKYLTPLVKNKPHLRGVIEHAPNKAVAAYELAKMAQQMEMNQPQQGVSQSVAQPTPATVKAQRMVENSRRPGTLAQAGGQSTLSKADYYASMSDAEFIKFASQNLEGI